MEPQFLNAVDISAKGLEKHNALKKDIDGKMAEMKKLAASDTKLNNDFIRYQQRINEIDRAWKAARATSVTIAKIKEKTENLTIPFDEGLPNIGEGEL